MIEYLRFGLCALFSVAGVVIIFLALFGVFRFDFVMNRMHFAGMVDSLGIVCILIGLMIASGELSVILKLITIVLLLWIGSPISTHLVSRLELSTDESAFEHMQREEGSEQHGDD